MEVVIFFLILFLGSIVGSLIATLLRWFIGRNKRYSGTIRVIENDDKTVFSLELDDDPYTLRSKKEIIFKVDTSGKSSDRE